MFAVLAVFVTVTGENILDLAIIKYAVEPIWSIVRSAAVTSVTGITAVTKANSSRAFIGNIAAADAMNTGVFLAGIWRTLGWVYTIG